jgi:peptidoglycan/xylan/chitin deacetylase (PgdA/CDA1 family)
MACGLLAICLTIKPEGARGKLAMPSYDKMLMKLLHYSGAASLLSPWLRGRGTVFMLHHVLPTSRQASNFTPNAGLEVTPEFLDDVIQLVKSKGYGLVSLEEAAEELGKSTGSKAPFAVFTLDDGYLDNHDHAWPVFRAHSCPFTIFVAPGIADGKCELWWRGLELLIASNDELDLELAGERFQGSVRTDAEKWTMFRRMYWPLRLCPETEQRHWIRSTCAAHGIDLDAVCRQQAMTWDDIRAMNRDRLCTIGAHTVSHHAMKKLTGEKALNEATGSRDRIAKEIGEVPQTFAYPYGDETSAGPRDFELIREAGFKVAVTTRKGMIFDEHKDHLTSLPRFSLNGGYQEREYTDVLLTGAPFAMFNKMQRVVTT